MTTSLSTETEVPVVKVGDFFVSSWGYDQTNIDFYKVVGITKSGKSVKVQMWSSALSPTDSGHFTVEKVVPGPGPATYNDWSAATPEMDEWERRQAVVQKPYPVETKRLRLGGYKGASFTVNSYSNAYLWDGKAKSQTASGYGH